MALVIRRIFLIRIHFFVISLTICTKIKILRYIPSLLRIVLNLPGAPGAGLSGLAEPVVLEKQNFNYNSIFSKAINLQSRSVIANCMGLFGYNCEFVTTI